MQDRQIAYMGDDLTDIPMLKQVGFAVAVRDCWTGLREVVDYVTVGLGGRGAVREVVELLLRAQGRWNKLTEKYYK
ncbi:MAG: HAD hydrolase family protein [Candidatus Binatia bacterium]